MTLHRRPERQAAGLHALPEVVEVCLTGVGAMQLTALHMALLPATGRQHQLAQAVPVCCCRPSTMRMPLTRSAAVKAAAAPSHLYTLASAVPFAAPDPYLPVSSIADMRQVGTDLDDMFSSSPFSTMRRFDDMMEQQFQQMDPFGGPSFSSMTQRMQQQMQDMDRQMDRAFADVDRVQRQLDVELERSLKQLQEQQPGVRIERREEKAPGSYRYYESIQISSGTSWTTLTPAHTSGMVNPLLLVALVLAGAYAGVTAAFARNFELTTYRERDKWQLLLLWPLLALFSKPFWRQLSSALRGEKVRVQDSVDGDSSANNS